MIKVYCDRCGKEAKYDDEYGRRSAIEAAANGDDILFTVEVHALSKSYDGPGHSYHYNSPELCPDCMREISNAIKTVWDGKYDGLRRDYRPRSCDSPCITNDEEA